MMIIPLSIFNIDLTTGNIILLTSLLMFVVPVVLFMISQSNVLETMATSGIKE